MSDYATPHALVSRRVGPAAPRRPERPLRRGRRRHRRLRAEPPARRGRLELDQPALRRRPARHRQPRRPLERSCRDVGHRPGHPHRALRRQQQLVRGLGVLAAQAARRRRTSASSTAAASTGSTTACPSRVDVPVVRAHGHQPAGARLRAARLPRRHPAAPRATPTSRSWTCARPAEFNGEVIAPPGMTETAQRGGPHPWRGLGALGADGQRGRHASRAPTSSRAHYAAKGVTADKDIVAYCRIGERSSHTLVRAPRAARLPAGPQLRRLVDRVGLA